MAKAAAGNAERFLTLTINPQVGDNPADRLRILAHAWRTIVKRAHRRWPTKSIEYLAVVEATKLGEPHLHILIRGPYMPWKWISSCMDELAHSPVVVIKKVRDQRGVVNYLAKYITKKPEQFAGSKRYWTSQRWEGLKVAREPRATAPGYRWEVAMHDLTTIVRLWVYSGWAVRADGKGGILARPGTQLGGEGYMDG